MLSSPHSQHNQSVSSLQQQQIHPHPQQQLQQQQHQMATAAHIYSNQQLMLHHSNYSMESEEGDIEDNRPPSLSSSKSNLTENSSMDHHSIHSAAMRGKTTPSMQKVHQFLVRTFSSPTKCNHCTSLMVSTQPCAVISFYFIISFFLYSFGALYLRFFMCSLGAFFATLFFSIRVNFPLL